MVLDETVELDETSFEWLDGRAANPTTDPAVEALVMEALSLLSESR